MRVPRSTYRIQLNGEFTFRDAMQLVPYLSELGVGDLYASPYMEARPGSTHGYDIVDHNRLNPEIGSSQDYETMVETLHAHGMGQLLDWVPNHMGVGPDNSWWMDVLEHGPASPYARFFDIDWNPTNRSELHGKVMLPVLGDHYRTLLEGGELELGFDQGDGSFSISYYENRCPVDPRTYPTILNGVTLIRGVHAAELQSISTSFANLPARERTDDESIEERTRDSGIHGERLALLCVESDEVALALMVRVAEINEDPALLHAILEEQAYRLVYWRVASDEINYRRFFSVNDLAGIRVEDERVFEATHRLLLELVREGKVDGIRLDHPDGLYDPARYFRDLQRAISDDGDFYVLVEKILADHESLPNWPVSGATGYEFANLVGGLFVDQSSEVTLTRIYERFVGAQPDFERLLHDCKMGVMRDELASELNVLSRRLMRIAEGANGERFYDFTIQVLRDALSEVVAHFPVYRTYIRDSDGISREDREYIDWAVKRAKNRSNLPDDSVFDFIKEVLLEEDAGTSDSQESATAERRAVRSFVGKFQQYTGPAMAKGMEDTALYRYNRLVSLNEVGGEPHHFGTSVAAFHRVTAERAKRWPNAMLSTSTHDTKRSEDVRSRISVLSELAPEWRANLAKWSRINRSRRRETESGVSPSRNDEYLFYQTLLGAWPLADEFDMEEFAGRIRAYMEKAMRESGERTSWTKVDEEYESGVMAFVGAVLEPSEGNLFLREFVPFQRKISRLGAMNSLSQTLVKLTAPGVPDIYQGNELWDLSLVDPDNRRPVDYDLRRRILNALKAMDASDSPGTLSDSEWQTGTPKLYLTWRVLSLRSEMPELFESGAYVPLPVEGDASDHIVAFARVHDGRSVIIVAPRLYERLSDDSDDLRLDPNLLAGTLISLEGLTESDFRSVLTGETVTPEGEKLRVSEIISDFPVALLVSG